MTLGELVRDASRTLARTAHLTIPLVVAFEIPLVLLEFADDEPLDFSVTALYGLVGMISEGAVLVLAEQALREAELAPGAALRTSLGAFGRNFVTGLVSNLLVMLWALLLIVPGVWRALTYVLAVPIAIHEGRMGREACDLSAERMKGRLGPALVALALAWAGAIAIELGLFVADDAILAGGELPSWYPAFTVVAYILPIVAMLPISAVQAVLYHRTRPRRHADVADVFA